MRKRFEQQTTLGILPVSDVKINTKSRDELPPVLVALQQIFVTPELNEKIFLLLEDKISNSKKKTGRAWYGPVAYFSFSHRTSHT